MNLNFEIYKSLLNTEIETAKLYFTYSQEDYKLSKKYLYHFNKETKLWVETEETFVIANISQWLLDQQIRFTNEFNQKLLAHPKDTTDLFKTISEISKNTKKITSFSHLTRVYKYFTKLINDDEFVTKLNHAFELFLPIKNGLIVDLTTSITSPREKHHLFSYECPVEITMKKTDFLTSL